MAGAISFTTNGSPELLDLQAQLNARPQTLNTRPGGPLPVTAPGSLHTVRDENGMTLHITGPNGVPGTGFHIPSSINLFAGVTTSTGAPTTTEYPDDGEYGFHYRSSNDRFYWTVNYGGTIRFPHLATLEGAVSDLSGTITLTQHGDLSGDALTKHKFAQISGAITATQHGSQTLATLHAVADASNNGFMTAAQVTKLANYPADCTAVANDSNAVQRVAGVINAVSYNSTGVRVVGARQTGWALATGTADRTTFATATVTLAELAQRVKALIDDLHATAGHGLIGT
jgi:hypothetical protein